MSTSSRQTAALFALVHQVFVRIRSASGSGNNELAYALADSFEELPAKVMRGDPIASITSEYEKIYLKELFASEGDNLMAIKREWCRFVEASRDETD
jgi:hypothetical protein